MISSGLAVGGHQRTSHGSNQEEVSDSFHHINGNMNNFAEYPYNNEPHEPTHHTHIGNGQIPHENDAQRKPSIKITIPRELPQRYILVLMGCLALVNVYMMHLNLFVALPAMIDHNATTEALRALSPKNESIAKYSEDKALLLQHSNRDGRNWSTKLKLKDKELLKNTSKDQSHFSSKENLRTDNIAKENVLNEVIPPTRSQSNATTEKLAISLATRDVTNNFENSKADQSKSLNSRRKREALKINDSSTETPNSPISQLLVIENGTVSETHDPSSLHLPNIDLKDNKERRALNIPPTTNINDTDTISLDTHKVPVLSLLNQKLSNNIFNFSKPISIISVSEVKRYPKAAGTFEITTKPTSTQSIEITTKELNIFDNNKVSDTKISSTTSSPINSQNHDSLNFIPVNITDSSSNEENATNSIFTYEPTSTDINEDIEMSETIPVTTIINTTPENKVDAMSSNVSTISSHSKDLKNMTDVNTRTTSIIPDETNDDTMNSENFVTELPMTINVEDPSTQAVIPSDSEDPITENLTVTKSTDENLHNGHNIGILLFTIPSVDTINNTIIPDVKKTSTERIKPKLKHKESSLLELSTPSTETLLPNFGIPLPKLNFNETSTKNNSLLYDVPLSIPCQKFMFINCTMRENTYDILDNQGTYEANSTDDNWVTLRPLPKNDLKTRLKNGYFHNIFGDTHLNFDFDDNSREEMRKTVHRKYNFTDHFKLVNCSRVNATENDSSDNEINCFSSFGEIRLSIVDEKGEGSSSSSSSSSEEGSVEAGSKEKGKGSEEEGDEEVDGEDENDEKLKDERHSEHIKFMNHNRRFSKQRKHFSHTIERQDIKEEEEEENEEGDGEEGGDKDGEEEGEGEEGEKDKEGEGEEGDGEKDKEDEEGTENKAEEENEEEENENDKSERKFSPRFRSSDMERLGKNKHLTKEDSSEEYDEEEEEDEEGEGEEEEEEEGKKNKKGKGYGSSPIVLDEKIPSSVCFVKKIVGEVKFEGYDHGEFVWLPTVQTELLWAYYWGFLITQIPGGKLSAIVGGKLVLLVGVVFAGLITLLSPILASAGPYWLLTGRVLLGMSQGLCIPAIQSMLAQWAPPMERTRMVAFTYSGIGLGAALGGPFSEYLVQVIGWRTLFYGQGILALLWGICWFFLVTDSPSTHPKITSKEKQLVLSSIGQQHAGKSVPVPWCSIIRSQHVLALMLAQGSFKWAWHNLIHYAPRYVLTVLHRHRSETEWVWGVAFGCMFVTTCVYGTLADWLRKSRKTSTLFIRRFANSICSLVTALFLVGVAQFTCNFYGVKVCFALAIAIGVPGAFSGIYANSIDLAPNHAGVITGICGTFATTANVLAPFYWNLIVYERPTLERWRTIWYTSAIFLLLANCLYFLLVGPKEQRWNRPVNLTKTPKRREEEQQGAISKRRITQHYPHTYKNQAYASTEHL